jgi:hypothetical protein
LQLVKNLPSDVSLRNTVNLGKAAKALGMPVVMTVARRTASKVRSRHRFSASFPKRTRNGFEVQAVMDASGSPIAPRYRTELLKP